jgi:hypothetical protein
VAAVAAVAAVATKVKLEGGAVKGPPQQTAAPIAIALAPVVGGVAPAAASASVASSATSSASSAPPPTVAVVASQPPSIDDAAKRKEWERVTKATVRERLTAIADAARTTATIPEGVTSTENFEGLDAFTAGVNPDDSPAHVQFFVAKVERLAASRLRQYCEQLHLTQSMVDQVSAALSRSLSLSSSASLLFLLSHACRLAFSPFSRYGR